MEFDDPLTWKSVNAPLDEVFVSFTLWTVAKLLDNNRVDDVSEIWRDSIISTDSLLFSNIDYAGWKNDYYYDCDRKILVAVTQHRTIFCRPNLTIH